MKANRKHLIIGAVIALLVGASFYPMFPDPYHEKGLVCFWEWLFKEIDEIFRGER